MRRIFPVRTLRDVAIIMLLALFVAFAPSGGNFAEAVLTAITMGFLAAIAWMVFLLGRQNQLTLATLTDGRRTGLRRSTDSRSCSPGQTGIAIVIGMVAWALTAFLDKDRQFLHDRLAGTRLVLL